MNTFRIPAEYLGLLVTLLGPITLLSMSTLGVMAFVLMMPIDLSGAALGVSIYVRRSKGPSAPLSIKPAPRDTYPEDLKRAA